MSGKNFRFLITCILLATAACKKESVTLNPVPSIEFVSISPSSPRQYTDTLTIKIKYTDGDGDLGENNSSSYNCFVKDNRNGIINNYRIRQLAPDQNAIAITGTLEIKVTGQFITDSTAQQQVSYNVYVKDRAGNESNSVTTSSVTLIR